MKNLTKIVDLRSDTVTLPSKEMITSIANSELGDDVFQEDPTVNQLENTVAKLVNKESAILVPSGTMGNLIAILIHAPRGTEVILGDKSHTFIYEAGGISAFGGIHSHQLKNNDDGTIDLNRIKNAIRDDNIHFPRTSLISLENTHNMCYGTPISEKYINLVKNIADEYYLPIHVDGARIFNSAISQGLDIKKLTKHIDSITFCLSKGLAAPIGSMLCGSEKFINEARRIRKALGGGMRQAGIIASAGLFSLKKFEKQIRCDHSNAQILAQGINEIDGLNIDISKVKTNIIYFSINKKIMSGKDFVKLMACYNIKFFEVSENRFRLVTHYGIDKSDIDYVLSLFNKFIK